MKAIKVLILSFLVMCSAQLVAAGELKKSEPLLAPLTADEWTAEQKIIFAHLTSNNADGKRPLNILGTIAHHPEVLKVFMPWATALGATTTLPTRELEILALRTAWWAESDYEWEHHFEFGETAGLSKKQMRTLKMKSPSPGWGKKDRLLIRAADELMNGVKLQPQTVKKLLDSFSKKEVVEIIWIVNQYNSLSKFANSLNIQLEDVYFR